MILQYSGDRLVTFEKRTGMTGIFTDQELELVKTYAGCGVRTAFIDRLFNLGIFCRGAEYDLRKGLRRCSRTVPYALHIDSTTACPLHCSQCYKGNGGDTYLPLYVFQHLIAEAEKLHMFQIAIGGGEPLMHPNLVEMVAAAAETEMAVTLTTSGCGLAQARLQELITAGINHIQISLNGSTEEVHGRSREGFQDAVQALRMLAESSCSFGVNWVARKDNLDNFPAVVDYARDLGADNINILRYKPSPTEVYREVALAQEEFGWLADQIRQVRGVTVKVDSAFSNLLVYVNHGRVSATNCGCGAGKSFVAVTAEGKFKPCSHLRLSHQSASLKEYLASTELQVFLATPVRSEDCGGCSYQRVCGGCRAICHRVTGDMFAGEMACPAFKKRAYV